MRITTVFRRLVGVTRLFVKGVRFEPEGLVIQVRPSWRRPRCGNCRRRAPGYDRSPIRRWRHLALGRMKLWLEYAPRRVDCPDCGVRSEEVSWAEPASRFSETFEEMVAYLAQGTDKTQVTRLQGISWTTVGSIVSRVVERRLDHSRLTGLRRIGVDEFSYRRRQRYLTVVVDHDQRRLVWAAAGSSAETLGKFFDALSPEGCAQLECVTLDMSAGYEKAIRQHAPHAQIIFDRFHVQRLVSDAVDAVRRDQLRDLRGTEEGRDLFRSRFALLKSPWNLTPSDEQKLHDIQRTNKWLYRAYLLKETLADALDSTQPWRMERKLRDWLAWASRSRLGPLVKAARTIRKHFDGILAYSGERLTNGLTEGLNNRLRMVARRAYGFHSANALIAMGFLCCGGIKLDPPLPT